MKKAWLTSAFISIFSLSIFAQTQITFYTNYGTFQAEMYDSLMPITAGNFINLVDSQFYDGIIFHRVVPNFVIQGGDPLGNGFGGPGYTIPDEFDSTGTLSNIKQTISMANAGPNTGGSQFFINLKNNTFLDYDKPPLTSAHPIFGIVKTGWNVVDSIGKVPTGANNKPINPVIMDSVRVTGSYLNVPQLSLGKLDAKIYPNPLTEESILDIACTHTETLKLAIYTSNGQQLQNATVEANEGKNKISLAQLGMINLPPGLYVVKIFGSDKTITLCVTALN